MRERWQPVGILAAALFAVNVVARLVVRLFAHDNDPAQVRIGFVAMGLIGVLAGVAMFLWARPYPLSRAAGDVTIGVLAGCLLSVLIGPFVSGAVPFGEGAGAFFAIIWQYLGFAALGSILALVGLVVAGQDYRSRALKRYAESQRVKVKPRKPARR